MQLAQGLEGGFNLVKDAAKIGYGTETARPIEQIMGTIIQVFITLLGLIFLGLAIYAGYLWMTARGKDEQVQKAKDILEQSTIGIVIILAAYAITAFIVNRLTTATGTGVGTPPEAPGGELKDPWAP